MTVHRMRMAFVYAGRRWVAVACQAAPLEAGSGGEPLPRSFTGWESEVTCGGCLRAETPWRAPKEYAADAGIEASRGR